MRLRLNPAISRWIELAVALQMELVNDPSRQRFALQHLVLCLQVIVRDVFQLKQLLHRGNVCIFLLDFE